MITVLHETENYLIINKPAGLMVHPDGKSEETTLVDWIMEHHPEMAGVGEKLGDIERPGIVHRLDRDTSGVLVLAKNQPAFEHLKQQFKDRKVQKTYHAIVYGWPKDDKGVVDQPIGRSKKNFRAWISGRGARGTMRAAVTEYHVQKRFEHDGEPYTYIELHPKTGRTHQIRVHMKYMNHPIVADELYAGKRAKKLPNLGFTRHALHASRITFTGSGGETITAEAPLPVDFTNILK